MFNALVYLSLEHTTSGVWARPAHGRGQGVGVQRVDDHRLHQIGPKVVGPLLAAGRAHHLVASLDELSNERPSDRPRRPGDEDPHPSTSPQAAPRPGTPRFIAASSRGFDGTRRNILRLRPRGLQCATARNHSRTGRPSSLVANWRYRVNALVCSCYSPSLRSKPRRGSGDFGPAFNDEGRVHLPPSLIEGDVAEGVSKLKQQDGKEMLVFGSGELVRRPGGGCRPGAAALLPLYHYEHVLRAECGGQT